MSESIKASEVSDVLRMQLEGIDTKLRFDEVGTVLQVSDGVVRIYGLQNAEANELLEFENGIPRRATIRPSRKGLRRPTRRSVRPTWTGPASKVRRPRNGCTT